MSGTTLIQDDLMWEAWPQTWGSYALGYGGIAGQVMATAQTVIVYSTCSNAVAVYFGCKRLAYVASMKADGWSKAYASRSMPDRSKQKLVKETE